MKPMDELERVERSTYRYWYTDGLAEIATGGVFGLLGIFFLIQATAQSRVFAMLSAIVLPLLLVAGGLFSRQIVAAAKNRLTYPRTGYVTYRQPKSSRRWVTGILAMFMAMVFVIAAQRVKLSLASLLLVEGLAIAVGMAFPAYKYGLLRFYGLACLSVLAAAGAAVLTTDANMGNAICFGVNAVGLLVSGGLTLLSYLRQTRPPEEREDA